MTRQYSPGELVKYGGVVENLFSGTVTESGNTNDNPVLVLPYSTGMFFLRCTAMEGGVSQELEVSVQTKDPAGDYWFYLMDFWPSLTDIGGRIKIPFMIPILGEKLAIEYTLTDITSVTFSVNAVLKI